MIKKLLLILLFVQTALIGISQNIGFSGKPPMRIYKKEEYGLSDQVWCAVQDNSGKMFFGTSNGIAFFDGINWNSLKLYDDKCIRSLGKDKNGRIYVGSIGEFGYLAYNSAGTLQYVSLIDQIKTEKGKFNDIWQIVSFENKVGFFSAEKFFIYDIDKNTIEVVNKNSAPIFAFGLNNKLFVLPDNEGIGIYENGTINLLPGLKNINFGDGIVSILPYEKDKIMIVSSVSGLWIYDLAKLPKDPKDYSKIGDQNNLLKKFDRKISDFLVKSNIYSCTRINDSLFAFGTFVNGLVVIDKNGKIFQIINDKKGLPTNYILRMYVDNFQNLWLLLSEGMVQVDILSPLLHFDESDGLLGTVDNVVYHDSCYYISTMKNFFRLQSQNTENISRPALTKLNEKNSYYWTQTEINGILFTIQFEQIAYLKDDKIIPIPDTKSQYLLAKTAKFPNYLFFSLNNKICASEISVDRKKNVKLGQLLKFPEFTAIVREMKTDRDGNFWFFDNYANLYCIKFTDNQDITKYKYLKADTSEYYQKDFLKDISVINDTIVIYGKNQLLTPTVTNDDKIKFVPFHNFPTDKNSKLKNLYLTKNGADYFCITDSGVCISTKKNKFRFDFNPFIAISNPKNIINTDKYFWILTSDNILYQYDKFRTAEYDRPFKVLIRKVYSNTDSLIFNGEYIDNNSKIGKFFTKTIAEQPENSIPVFKYRHNSISFSYSAVFFEHSESTLYQYKLEGFDENWSNFSKAVLKEYTNLPPGKYCFKIRAKNIYNTMSSKTEYRFVILKPWYRTIVAYVSYFVILFLLIYLIVYLNGRRLKSANIKLERIVRERTHEIFQQKEEISAQADELQTQAEQLQLINIELEKLSIAASETDNAIIIMDADTNFEWVNLGFTKLLGFTFDELLQNFGKRLLDSSSNSNIADVIETSRKTMNSVIYDSKIKTKDGSEIWTQTTITPIIKNNKIVKFIAIDSDIRKLKDAEHIIKLKNEQITSSIRYAKTIQSAILPIKEQIDRYFENFIIYRPKDIVSGDFYWYNRIGDYHFVGVIDCTGHGVPGAFMSMIGNTLLNEIIISQKIYEPDMILNSLDDRSRKSLHQDLSESRDGMDLCLCRIEKTENKFQLKYAGAKCPLLYFNSVKNELETLKANRISIGGLKKNLPQTFTAQTIELSSGDFIIMSSDGFSDQNNRQRERFGTLQVIDILVKNKEKNISEIGAIMEKSLNNWMDGTNQRDDITMIGVAF